MKLVNQYRFELGVSITSLLLVILAGALGVRLHGVYEYFMAWVIVCIIEILMMAWINA